jgi:hypothetical protein
MPEASKDGGRPRIYLDASGLPQRVLREAAAEHAYGRDIHFSRRFGVVGRVTDRHGIVAFHPKLLQDRFKDVGSRLGFLNVVRTRRHFDEALDARDAKRLFQFVLLSRGRDAT